MNRKQPRLKRPTPRRPARPDWPPEEMLLPSLAELRRLSEPEPVQEQLRLFEQRARVPY